MQQELTQSQLAMVAGSGLYDHLPAPSQPISLPSQTAAEKRQILEQPGLGNVQAVPANYPPL
ncbi:MAG: hypothetical protein OXF31_00315 [Gammaproteobacteria bacterium]|nr:hypothetical protein [Gammaproteobacteria bacterium]